MKKKKWFIVLVIMLLCLIGVGLRWIAGQQMGATFTDGLEAVVTTSSERETENVLQEDAMISPEMTALRAESIESPIDFRKVKETAPEAYAWIRIPDTEIDYPICQSAEDNGFYLDHNEKQMPQLAGAIYTEDYNAKDFQDPVTVIYGHNMRNGSMFQNLHLYEDRMFFDAHREFYIYTPEKTLTYRVFAAFTFDNSHLLKTYDFSNQEVFDQFFSDILHADSAYANIADDTDVKFGDKIVTLSTCSDTEETRFMVQAVLEDA